MAEAGALVARTLDMLREHVQPGITTKELDDLADEFIVANGGKSTSRGDIYANIIADPKAPADGKAYALYRAINCYAPSGNNTCGNAEHSFERG